MSDEESDPEAQGVDALRLLKQGSHNLARSSDRANEPTQRPRSVPLVPLFASVKRSRSLSQDLSEQPRPSGAQKVQAENAVNAAGMLRNPSPPGRGAGQERDIRQHKSAPEQFTNLDLKELSRCKSAPVLTLPALAAIRGLQNGTLQVDRHTRMKIAAAAKRVLEARELKRRSSLEREPSKTFSFPQPLVPEPVSPMAVKSQTIWDIPGQGPNPASPRGQELKTVHEEEGESLDSSRKQTNVPESLATAAAIASGQTPSTASKANFHRPALGTVSQGGALLSTSHRPFTVTTGLPRFATDTSHKEEQGMLDVTSTTLKEKPQYGLSEDNTNSKALFAEQLFKPHASKS